MDELIDQFPYTGLVELARPCPTLRESLLYPVGVVQSTAVENPDGILDSSYGTLLKPADRPAEIVLDFGRETVGKLEMAVKADRNGSITVNYGEFFEEVVSDEQSGADWYYPPQDILPVTSQWRVVKHEGRRAFRYVRIRAFEADLQVTIKNVVMTQVQYPVDYRGSFECSDVRLNSIWDICKLTTELCMQKFYEDGIKRDGLLWVSDYRAQFLCNWMPFGDSELARRSLIMFAASQRVDGLIPATGAFGGGHQHPDNISYMPGIPQGSVDRYVLIHYASDYLSCLHDYAMYTGDVSLLKKLKPTIARLVDFLSKYDYNYDPAREDLVTESDTWRSHGTMLMQVITGINDGQKVALLLNDNQLYRNCLDFAKVLRQKITTEYYDSVKGCFTDAPVGSTDNSTSLHVNYFAVIAGLVTGKDAAGLLNKVKSFGVREAAWGGMRMWQHVAEFEAGLTDAAIDGIRAFWGFMLDRGATTAWEACDMLPDGTWKKIIGSRCHGWSAGACYLIPGYLTGIRPATPGFERIKVVPHTGDIEWIKASIPTPKGNIHIELESGKGGRIEVPREMLIEDIPAGLEVYDR